MDIVAKHFRLWASTGFSWDGRDCAIVLADYVLDVTGMDGAAHLRGMYRTRAGCNHVTGFLRRGLVAVVGECAAKAGLLPCEAPGRGDIGVVQFGRTFAGALCSGAGRWGINSLDGLMMVSNPTVVAAWAVRG